MISETTTEVANVAPEILVGSSTTKLLPKSGTETVALPTVDNTALLSHNSLERVDTTEYPQAAKGARVASGVGSPGTATQSEELSSGWTVADSELGLFFRRGDMEVALRYGDYWGLRNSMLSL